MKIQGLGVKAVDANEQAKKRTIGFSVNEPV